MSRRRSWWSTSKHDPGTGHNAASNVARQLGRGGVLLTYEGWGHGVYPGRSGCVDAIVTRYLVEQALPARGTSCPAVEPDRSATRLLGSLSLERAP